MRVAVLCSLDSQPVEAAVRRVLADRGAEVRFHDLTHERFAPCQGCFECWLVHPGTCKAKDHANEVMRDIVASDAVIWFVRPRFGAWDPVAKAALESTNRYLARAHGATNVRFNLVAAGPIRTIAAKSIPAFKKFEDAWDVKAPLGWDVSDSSAVARSIAQPFLRNPRGYRPGFLRLSFSTPLQKPPTVISVVPSTPPSLS